MRKITAKSLFQETWEVDVPPAASISDVLAQLAAADPRLTNVSLLLHVRLPASAFAALRLTYCKGMDRHTA